LFSQEVKKRKSRSEYMASLKGMNFSEETLGKIGEDLDVDNSKQRTYSRIDEQPLFVQTGG
jgi:hypothetical protein